MTPLSGKFIVIDGGEGCGKSTQARLLAERLEREGRRVLSIRDPGTTRVGEMIRQILLDPKNTDIAMRCEMFLYMSARAQMMAETILPALNDGMIVICDRFVSSTLAYQLGGDGLTADEIKAAADIAIRRRWPDLTVILDMPVEASATRVRPKFQSDPAAGGAKDRIEQRSAEYHQQVRKNYLLQARENPDRYCIIDASREMERVHDDLFIAVSRIIE